VSHDPEDANPGRKLDEDAAWRAIVQHYGDRARLDEDTPQQPGEDPAAPTPSDPSVGPGREPPVESRGDALNTEATWDDEGHFVPPEPPPLPALEPRRRLAWAGMFGSPLLMLIAVVFGWSYPGWVMGALMLGFVGGFVYLVATMQRNRPDDWSGDDGAVV
jgi:hypothetical protein